MHVYIHVFDRARLTKEPRHRVALFAHNTWCSDRTTANSRKAGNRSVRSNGLAGFVPTLFLAMRSRVQNLIAFRAELLAIVQTNVAPDRFFRGEGEEKDCLPIGFNLCQAASIASKHDDVISKHDNVVWNLLTLCSLSEG